MQDKYDLSQLNLSLLSYETVIFAETPSLVIDFDYV